MDLMLYEDKIVTRQKLGRIEGFLPAFIPELEEEPKIVWHGAKVPSRLWERIKSFMRHTQEKFNSEAQIRLYYNDQTNRWRALAWPQYIGTGLFSAEIAGRHENKAKLLKLVSQEKGWYEFGTVHHHCTASAFQSGTDHKDEINRPGIHITLGHILSDSHDIHARFVTKQIQYKVDLAEWIEGDLTSSSKTPYPAIWLEQCFEKPKVVHTPYQWRSGAGFGMSSGYYVYVPGHGYRRRDEAEEIRKASVFNSIRELSPAEQRAWDWDDEDDLDTPPKIKLPCAKQEQEKLEEEALASLASTMEANLVNFVEQSKADIFWATRDLSYDLGDKTEDIQQEFKDMAMEMLSDMLFNMASEIFNGEHDDEEGMELYE